MNNQTTYGFLDSVVILAHSLIVPAGLITLSGEGIGKATVSMRDERTAMDTAADGSVMISKIAGNTGTVAIDLQQTSLGHKALLSLYNLVILADPTMWAQAALTMRNITDGTSHIATGVAFTKLPDKTYQKDGQHVTWQLMCADIQNANF